MNDYTLFSTPIGTCGVAWSARGLVCLQLPALTIPETSALLCEVAGGKPADPPDWVKDAIARITRYLEGQSEDLSAIRLDFDRCAPFHRKVYEIARQIGRGKKLTYGEVAARAGSPRAARAVGQALAKNPLSILIPCHRVVAAGGKPGGFSAPGGLVTKARLLALEGAGLS